MQNNLYTKIKLTKKDLKFIDKFMINYRIGNGRGYRIVIERFLSDYKKEECLK